MELIFYIIMTYELIKLWFIIFDVLNIPNPVIGIIENIFKIWRKRDGK